MLINPAYAQSLTGGSGDILSAILPFVLIIGVFYFLMLRPQQKKQKEHKAKLDAIRRGDRVILGGGIYGLVQDTSDTGKLSIEIAPQVTITVLRSSVLEVLSKTEPVTSGSSTAAKDSGTTRKRGRKPKEASSSQDKAEVKAKDTSDESSSQA